VPVTQPHAVRDQRVDRLANSAAGTMQQHTLVLGADAEQGAGLRRFPAFHVAQHDDGALAGRQAFDRLGHVVP
jgi:hypothetical protein